MLAVIALYIFNKNGGSIPVCTERKATGEYVLACFLSATMQNTAESEKTNNLIDDPDRDVTYQCLREYFFH